MTARRGLSSTSSPMFHDTAAPTSSSRQKRSDEPQQTVVPAAPALPPRRSACINAQKEQSLTFKAFADAGVFK